MRTNKNGKKVLKPRIFLIFGIILVVVLGVFATSTYLKDYLKNSLDDIERVPINKEVLSCKDVDGYMNIALLGVDSRDMKAKNLKGHNTDCIIILSMNTETKDIKLLSVYRDTYLRINGTSSFNKVNCAFPIHGMEGCLCTLNEAMDLNIDKYVLFNFQMVSDLVNEVGGIEADVKQYEIQQLNKYTIQTAKNIGQKHYKLVKHPGKQTLEGVQAVSYGRIRKGVGDDFKRTDRMRYVIKQVLKKVKKCNFSELTKIMKICMKQCQTNMPNSDMILLMKQVPGFSIEKSYGWPFEVKLKNIDGISYILPNNLAKNVEELHKKMFGQEDYKVSSGVKKMSKIIEERAVLPNKNFKKKIVESKNTHVRGSNSGIVAPGNNGNVIVPQNPEEPTDGGVDNNLGGLPDTSTTNPVEPANPSSSEPVNPNSTEPVTPPGGNQSGKGGVSQ